MNIDFLAGGGLMGAYIRAYPWSTTSLGEPKSWPQSLQGTVRLMLATRQAMVVFWGPEHTCLYNDAYARSLGTEKHPSILGAPGRKSWDESWPIIGPQIEQVMCGEGASWLENQLVPIVRNGELQDVYWTYGYNPIDEPTSPAGVGGVLVVCTETTAQVNAERRLAAERERDGVTVDISAQKRSEAVEFIDAQRVQLALSAGAIIGTWIWDLRADRFTADELFARAFGLDCRRCKEGIPLADVIATVHPDDQVGLANAIEDATLKGGLYARQYRVRRADGKYYWIEANGRVDHGPDGAPLRLAGVLIDVQGRCAVEAERDRALAALHACNETLEQRIAERTAELMQSEEKLRQAQKMEAVGHLTGGLAHDFNNLLAGITGSLEFVDARVQQGRVGEIGRYIHAAQGAAKRAATLTHRLLAFSRRQTLDPKPTDVNRLVAGMSELLQRTIGPDVWLETIAPSDLWATLIDPGQLENALLNLCINARDAMPEGGKLTLETGNMCFDQRAANERDIAPGQYVLLSVSDTGIGMSAETMARAFDPFFTTKPIGVGTGLGLSMVYGFARQVGGHVCIRSKVGQGTVVCLHLPRHDGVPSDVEEEVTASGPIMPDQTESVLVVDDEPTVRMLVVDVLREMGCIAFEAADGAAGLKIINSGARIDLLVADVGLPGGMNGRQLAEAARRARPNLEVLFITGYAETATLRHARSDLFMHVLTKPFAVDDLVRQIKMLLANKSKTD